LITGTKVCPTAPPHPGLLSLCGRDEKLPEVMWEEYETIIFSPETFLSSPSPPPRPPPCGANI